MDAHIDYSKVASAISQRLTKQLADAIFELEQWRELATTAMSERDQLKEKLDLAHAESTPQEK